MGLLQHIVFSLINLPVTLTAQRVITCVQGLAMIDKKMTLVTK